MGELYVIAMFIILVASFIADAIPEKPKYRRKDDR